MKLFSWKTVMRILIILIPAILSGCSLAEPGAMKPKIYNDRGEVVGYISTNAIGQTVVYNPNGTKAYTID